MKTVRELRAAREAKAKEMRAAFEDADKFAALDAEISELNSQIERAERMAEVERQAEGRAIEDRGNGTSTAAEWRALARGEHRAMTAAGSTDGAALVPEQLAAQIQNRLVDISPVRSVANVITVSSGDFTLPVNVRGMASRWSGESDDRSAVTATPTVRGVRPTFGEINALPQVSNHLLDDAAYDVGAFIVENAATEFAEAEGNAFILGNGTSKPTGFLAGTPEDAGDSTRTAGELEYLASGVSGAFPATDPLDILVDLVYKLRAPYRMGAAWMMASTTAAVVSKWKDADKRHLWQPAVAAGQPATLLGYPVVIAEDMPAIAADAFPVAFGNFRAGYTIADRVGIRLIRDEVTAPGQTKFYLSKRVGGVITDDSAIKVLKLSVS